MSPQQNLASEQFQALKVASDKFCTTFSAYRTNPTDIDALNAWDEATSEFMTVVNNDELNIIASLLAAIDANKEPVTKQQRPLKLPPTRMTLAESKRRNMTWRELGAYNEGADVAVEKIIKTLATAGIDLVVDGGVL